MAAYLGTPINNGLFLKADVGLAAVLTKNRFLNDAGAQSFFHQFGIGTNAGLAAGYSLTPFGNKQKSLDIQASITSSCSPIERMVERNRLPGIIGGKPSKQRGTQPVESDAQVKKGTVTFQ